MSRRPPAVSPIALDKGRIQRALDHVVTRLGPGHYRIATTSATEDRDYYFYVQTAPELICYCSDAAYRAPVCKHVIAALISEDDPRIHPYRGWIEEAQAARTQEALKQGAVDGAASTNAASDEPLPDAWALDQAIAHHASDEMAGRSRRWAGRILTDPAVTLSALRQVAERCPKLHIRTALLRIPEAARDPVIRRGVVEDDPSPHIIARLMPTADDEEFRLLFRKLLDADALKAARRVVDEQNARALATLRPSDLTGFFESDKLEDREFGMTLLGSLARGGTAPTPKKKRPARS